MELTPELLAAFINFSTKFGIDAAIAIAERSKGATVDDLIAALRGVKPSIDDYINPPPPSGGVV